MEYILFVLLGGLISVLSGFFGVGGGFILTPILLLIGFSPLQAITTSLFFTVGTSLSGITAHIKLKNILWKEGLIMGGAELRLHSFFCEDKSSKTNTKKRLRILSLFLMPQM